MSITIRLVVKAIWKYLEVILVTTIVLFAVTGLVIRSFAWGEPSVLILIALWGYAVLVVFFLIKSRISFYSVVLILFLIQSIGAIFRILHLPSADLLIIIGYPLATITLGLSLVKTAWDYRSRVRIGSYYNLTIAVLILLDLGSAFTQLELRSFSSYLLIAVIFTMKMNRVYIKKMENDLLTLVLLGMVFYVLADTFGTGRDFLQEFYNKHALEN